MKQVTKTIHTVEFGKYRQEWELSFVYDSESVESVTVVAHTYKQGKYTGSNDITNTLDADLVSGMIDSIVLDEMKTEGELTDHLKDVKPMDVFSQLNEYFKP